LREDRSAGWLTPLFHLFRAPEMALRGLRSLVRPCFDFHDTRATAMFALPSGDDNSQWAQERLNRSKIGKAFAWK